MTIRSEWWFARLVVAGLAVFAYFVLYPQDLAAVVNPLERLLRISSAVSPGLYAVTGVAMIAWAIVRVWGNRPPRRPDDERAPTVP